MLLLDESLPTLHLELTLPKTARNSPLYKGKVIPKPEAGSSEPAIHFQVMTPMVAGVFGGGIPDFLGKNPRKHWSLWFVPKTSMFKSNKLFISNVKNRLSRESTKKRFFVHQNSDIFPWQKSLPRFSYERMFGKPWTLNHSCHSWGSYVLLWRVLVGQKNLFFYPKFSIISPMWGAKKTPCYFPMDWPPHTSSCAHYTPYYIRIC